MNQYDDGGVQAEIPRKAKLSEGEIMTPSERERAEFEKWRDSYSYGYISNWECWQAARREERKRCAEIVEDGRDVNCKYCSDIKREILAVVKEIA